MEQAIKYNNLRRPAIFLASVIYLILIIFISGNYFGWYQHYWWLDDLTHFLGGFWVAALFYYLDKRWQLLTINGRRFWLQLILGLGFVALVGLLWEFSEFLGDWYLQKPLLQLGVVDTISDLFWDLMGGLVFFKVRYVWFIFLKSKKLIKLSKKLPDF